MATTGTPKRDISRKFTAIASAWPRSSASMPGLAPGVSALFGASDAGLSSIGCDCPPRPNQTPRELTCQVLAGFRSADPFDFRPELLVRADLRGHIQDNGKIAGFFKPEPNIRIT